MRTLLATFCAVVLAVSAVADASNQLSSLGVTWYFNSNHTVGRFVSGDWWVLAPCTITNITPQTVTSNATVGGTNLSVTRNGSMINAFADRCDGTIITNGFDSLLLSGGNYYDSAKYVAGLNVGGASPVAPLTISTQATLVSAWSRDWTGSNIRPSQNALAVLTIVTSAPAADAFRPQPYRGDKTIRRFSQLDTTKLRTLTAITNAQAITNLDRHFTGWIPDIANWADFSQYTRPYSNCPAPDFDMNYGSYASEALGESMLLLNLDFTLAQKSNLLARVVQYGIDVYGAALDGATWADLGGLNNGRKGVLIFTANLFGDSAMLARCNGSNYFIFQDDLDKWIVGTNDVGRAVRHDDYPDKYRVEYISADVGKAEWGDQHTHAAGYLDGRNLDAAYRDICVRAGASHALMAKLMGLTNSWNYPPFVAYHERIWATHQTNGLPATDWGGNTLQFYTPFVANMWSAQGTGGDTPTVGTVTISPNGGTFTNSVEVTLTCATNSASIYYTTSGATPSASSTLYTAPFTLSASATVKAIGILAGHNDSAVASATFDKYEAPSPGEGSSLPAVLRVSGKVIFR